MMDRGGRVRFGFSSHKIAKCRFSRRPLSSASVTGIQGPLLAFWPDHLRLETRFSADVGSCTRRWQARLRYFAFRRGRCAREG